MSGSELLGQSTLNEYSAPDEDEDEEGALLKSPATTAKLSTFKLRLSFFLFGLINNVLYVIILSAALDLVPPNTPKGIIAFVNIFPALVAKAGGGYFVEQGGVKYAARIIGCTTLSVVGMLVVALNDTLSARLVGIALASFSSGLGELTFLQLSTTFSTPAAGGECIGYFASGTGGAGLVGAFLWWELRALGVRLGVGLSSVLPLVLPLTYFLILPKSSEYSQVSPNDAAYERVPTEPTSGVPITPITSSKAALSLSVKWRLVRPMLLKFMLPLFFVYLIEYTINQGISPTLLYPVPSPEEYWFLSKIIKSIRDYYPLWQLLYQTTVFFSRSSLSLGLPAIPEWAIPIPAVIQAVILSTLWYESAVGIFPETSEGWNIRLVALLIGIEGICGGLAYVNVFYRINQEPSDAADPEQAKQEREFKIGSVGFADSLGIVGASLLAIPAETLLCKYQVARGKDLCLSV